VIVASEKAKFIEVFINVGLALDSGSSFFLPRLVGMKKAFELATLGSEVSAEDANELGIVNQVAKPDQLDEAVQEWTDYYANAPTKAVGLIKKQLNKSLNADLEEMLEYEAYCQEIAGRTDDYKEGVQAFVEKRKPEFKGH
jgi:2-(1,2-epoxy-1,2-dihydrophenyl)acetyl-CoA isomerase